MSPPRISWVRRRCSFTNRAVGDDRGSMVPLILGFWLLALLFVAGSVALGDAFTKQRELQSICDGAAIAGATVSTTTRCTAVA